MADKRKSGPSSSINELSRMAGEKRRQIRGDRPAEEKTTMDVDFEMEHLKPNPTPDALGEKLVHDGLIDRHQLFQALNESYRSGKTLSEALISLGFIEQDVLEKAIKEA